MGFDKEYPNRKDWRKPYRGSKAFDHSCRNKGGCGYCQNNRLYFDKRNRSAADEELSKWNKGDDPT